MTDPVTPSQAHEKVRAFYERHYRTWAAECFREDSALGDARTEAEFSLPLHPPTESAVLKRPGAARAWARSWRESDQCDRIDWRERKWPSVGSQVVPEKLRLSGETEIAAFAGRKRQWLALRERMLALADRWKTSWHAACREPHLEGLPFRLARAARTFESLSSPDWQMLLLALDWLLAHPTESRYARELPIRGIDTKWIEQHKAAVSQLHAAFAGTSEFGIVMKAPPQIRVRFLDAALAPLGLRDVSASPAELNRYTGEARTVIICENLISVMTLPPFEGVVAIHGGGFGVSDLDTIGWLAQTPVLYWGDLDSHGFAILNRWRHHHTATRSLMMDEETLMRHRDLCVVDPSPNRAELDRLTPAECSALHLLFDGEEALRLEQERIEWRYAIGQIEEALGAVAEI